MTNDLPAVKNTERENEVKENEVKENEVKENEIKYNEKYYNELKDITDGYFTDDDLKVISLYCDDYTIRSASLMYPSAFAKDLHIYLSPKSLVEAFKECKDLKANGKEVPRNVIFDLILEGKEFTKKEIERLYERGCIPYDERANSPYSTYRSNDDRKYSMLDDSYYSSIYNNVCEDRVADFNYDVDDDDYYNSAIFHDFKVFLYQDDADYVDPDRVENELQNAKIYREDVQKIASYILAGEMKPIDSYSSLTEINNELEKIISAQKEKEREEYEASIKELMEDETDENKVTNEIPMHIQLFIGVYKDMFKAELSSGELSEEDLRVLAEYSDDFTTANVRENPQKFLKNINCYIHPFLLLNDNPDSRKKIFNLILRFKGYSNEEIQKVYDDGLAPVGANQYDICSLDYYNKLDKYLRPYSMAFESYKFDNSDYLHSKSLCKLGNLKHSYNVMNQTRRIFPDSEFLVYPERILYDLFKVENMDVKTVEKIVLYCELGYIDLDSSDIKKLDDVMTCYEALNGHYYYLQHPIILSDNTFDALSNSEAMFTVLAGNLTKDIKVVANELKISKKYREEHNKELIDICTGDFFLQKAVDFKNNYLKYKNDRIMNTLMDDYGKRLTQEEVSKLLDEVIKEVEFDNKSYTEKKLIHEFDKKFSPLVYKTPIAVGLGGIAAALTGSAMTVAGVSSLQFSQNFPKVLDTSNTLLRYLHTKPLSVVIAGSTILLVGASTLAASIYNKVSNAKKAEDLEEEYHLGRRL